MHLAGEVKESSQGGEGRNLRVELIRMWAGVRTEKREQSEKRHDQGVVRKKKDELN